MVVIDVVRVFSSEGQKAASTFEITVISALYLAR